MQSRVLWLLDQKAKEKKAKKKQLFHPRWFVMTEVSARGFGIWLGFYKMQSLQQEATLRYKLIRVRENAESIEP